MVGEQPEAQGDGGDAGGPVPRRERDLREDRLLLDPGGQRSVGHAVREVVEHGAGGHDVVGEEIPVCGDEPRGQTGVLAEERVHLVAGLRGFERLLGAVAGVVRHGGLAAPDRQEDRLQLRDAGDRRALWVAYSGVVLPDEGRADASLVPAVQCHEAASAEVLGLRAVRGATGTDHAGDRLGEDPLGVLEQSCLVEDGAATDLQQPVGPLRVDGAGRLHGPERAGQVTERVAHETGVVQGEGRDRGRARTHRLLVADVEVLRAPRRAGPARWLSRPG